MVIRYDGYMEPPCSTAVYVPKNGAAVRLLHVQRDPGSSPIQKKPVVGDVKDFLLESHCQSK